MTFTAQAPEQTPGPSASSSRRRRAPSTRPRNVVVALAAGAALIAGVVFALRDDGGNGTARAADPSTPPPDAISATSRPSPSSRADSPATATGVFVTAKSSGAVIGEGSDLRRYKVQVENGTGIDPKRAAAEIAAVLADKRGWTGDGRHSFQLVSDGPSDFEVKIATPDTVDKICGAVGLDTHGEVNCDAGTQIMVNLKRWNTGSPEFSGPISGYRALIINHEVGHRIGRGHETCPGKGERAPVMMQQIYGLKGCVANEWPYDRDGEYIGGPAVP
ncbi:MULTISPECIES: DUF3152 domain-containing protein [Streptomyces]|uniref:DUF3152 domain-containing protein n=1 Tax=Streptomyces lonegramiae TaxID=3075524 RepID=A0ABU2XJU4_9ACTN|nr:DUF3152 domain-containing protein [Streptomyces sp. DSM 41529]MDT0546166.1 DUF3152 domain-containing protein [Streptomyces sp. DSM 41529]